MLTVNELQNWYKYILNIKNVLNIFDVIKFLVIFFYSFTKILLKRKTIRDNLTGKRRQVIVASEH